MGIFALLVWLIALPALFTLLVVKVQRVRNPTLPRRRIVRRAALAGAILPLAPMAFVLARSKAIYNPELIAGMALAILGPVVAVLICLPVALRATRDMAATGAAD